MRTLLHIRTDQEARHGPLSAATHLLNRIDGLPVAKVVTSQADDLSGMTDEELVAEQERLRGNCVILSTRTTFRGHHVPEELRALIISDLADDPRGAGITFVWVTNRGAAGYDVLGWTTRSVARRTTACADFPPTLPERGRPRPLQSHSRSRWNSD